MLASYAQLVHSHCLSMLLQHVREVCYMIKFIHMCNVIYVRFTSRTWLPCELHSVDTPGVYLYRVRPYSSNLDICIYIYIYAF